MLLTMRHLEHRDFLLCCWPNASFLQHIPDNLRSNRGIYGWIYELGDLDSIVKLPRADLTDNWLFIMRGKLGRTVTRMIFLIPSTSLLILPIVPFPRPILAWIWQWEYPSLRRETTEEHFSAEMDFMVVVRSQGDEWTKFNMPNWYK